MINNSNQGSNIKKVQDKFIKLPRVLFNSSS